jgi:hypothetical protein
MTDVHEHVHKHVVVHVFDRHDSASRPASATQFPSPGDSVLGTECRWNRPRTPGSFLAIGGVGLAVVAVIVSLFLT